MKVGLLTALSHAIFNLSRFNRLHCLVPRPYPLTRRNGLSGEPSQTMGWRTPLQQCHVATFKTFYVKPALKGMDARVEIKKMLLL